MMRLRPVLILAALLLLPLSSLLAQAPPVTARRPLREDAEAIRALVAPLNAALTREGLTVVADPKILVVTRAELEPVLRAELEPQLRAVLAGAPEYQLGQAVDLSVDMFLKAALCKYGFSTKAIYVIPENFVALAELYPDGKLMDPDFFRAVFLHELVHACDDARHDMGKLIAPIQTAEALQAMNALIEGHAQFITRRILSAEGKVAWFEELEHMLTAPPPGNDASAKYLAGVLIANANVYADAERFFQAMAQRTPPVTFADLLANPPAGLDPILMPERYGQPAPVATLPLTLALDAFSKAANRPDWSHRVVGMTLMQLRATFSLLPAEQVAKAMAGILDVEVAVHAAQDGSAQIVAGVFEMADDDAARAMYDLDEALLRAKDEAMKEGVIRLVSHEYLAPVVQGADAAVLARKQVAVQGLPKPLPGFSLIVRQGRAVAEIMSVNGGNDEATLIGWAETLLARLAAK